MKSVLEVDGLQRRVHGISKRAKETLISPIKEMALLAERVEGAISLGWGIPSFATPTHILQAVQQYLAEDSAIGKYPHPRGLPELRQAIARRFYDQWGVEIDPQREILVTVGSQEAVYLALMTIIDPDDEVILLTPCFSSHIDQVILAGGRPVYVRLIEEDGWALRVENIEKAISPRTKAIILNSPANPSGAVFQASQLGAIGELSLKHDFFVITDETYNFLVYDKHDRFSLFSISCLRDRLIGCYSFSKEYAMTGWRVGYICGESGMIEEMMKIHDASVVTAPRVSQKAAFAALEGPQDCVEDFRSQYSYRRDLICSRLDRLSDLFQYWKPAGAYYIFPRIRVSGIDSFDLALRLLHEARIVTVPGEAFGPDGKGHLRFCFAVPIEDITEAFDRIEEFAQAKF